MKLKCEHRLCGDRTDTCHKTCNRYAPKQGSADDKCHKVTVTGKEAK